MGGRGGKDKRERVYNRRVTRNKELKEKKERRRSRREEEEEKGCRVHTGNCVHDTVNGRSRVG